MSKSTGDERSRLLLTDSTDVIHAKIMRALTDCEPGISYDPQRRPGVSNLLEMIAHLEDISPDQACSRYQDVSLRAFKEDAVDRIAASLAPIRDRLLRLLEPNQQSYLDEVASMGGEQARATSRPVLDGVYELIGLGRRH